MRVLLSTYGLRGDVEPLVGIPGVVARRCGLCAPPDSRSCWPVLGVPYLPPLARVGRRPVRHRRRGGRECDAPVATGVMPTGVWR